MMLFSDAVYGVIELPDFLVRRVVDTPVFQRLRRIKQIGLGHLVYPSHDGTRFQHSLGAAYLVGRALDSLRASTERYVIPKLGPQERSETRQLLELLDSLKPWFQYFMLLHDVGHGPLSHNYEDAVFEAKLIWGLEAPEAQQKKLHESVSKRIALKMLEGECGGVTLAERLCEESGNPGPCSEDPVKAVKSLLEPSPGLWDEELFQGIRTIYAFLSNGEIDVDRGDYLMRDAIMAGTRIGLFDYERLYSVLAIVPSDRGTPFEVAVLDKGVPSVESMLISRFYMYENVYYHKTTLLYSSVASRLMAWWLKEGAFPKIWEEEELERVDDCAFYRALFDEEDLTNLKEVVLKRKHEILVRKEVLNVTVNGSVEGLRFPAYKTEVDGVALADLAREEPELLAYGASIRPFKAKRLNVFVRSEGKLVDLSTHSPVALNLSKVEHVKFYLAAPKRLEGLVGRLSEELKKRINLPRGAP
ncbi:HD domain-containing protein [Ignicoccus hospitalis]|nr:HD domain-containing protein [Ignicoccus hospitalis]